MSQLNALEAFRTRFQGEPELLVYAPGRVNLIGEHTDYNEGFVFPAAIDRALWIAARRTHGDTRCFSREMYDAEGFDANAVTPGDVSGWGIYPAGVAWALREKGHGPLPNLEVALVSEIPPGSGVSSSAATSVAFAAAWNAFGELGLDSTALAQVAQHGENGFVGVNCGIMDQMAVAHGRAGHAMFLDTRSLEIAYAALPDGVAMVLCDTGTPRRLTHSAYNERRSQCEAAAVAMGVRALRDATLPMLDAIREQLDAVVYHRAAYVIRENDRAVAFRAALEKGDRAELGYLMAASHAGLRDDYQVSSPELDAMASLHAPGLIGIRMTGAGFGGACIALAEESYLEPFMAAMAAGYQERTGRTGAFIACRASDGVTVTDIRAS
ncbi:MAG: galactokinase [Fimbriimonadaceae bacterium]